MTLPSDGFEFCLQKIFDVEGGYSDNPADPGGPTRWGISSRAFPAEDLSNLTLERAKNLYRVYYWDPVRGNNLWVASPPLTLLTFDGAVQHGVKQSILLLQRALRVKDDGVLGAASMAAVNKASTREAAWLLALRAEFYTLLIQKQPRMVEFRRGWFDRLFRMSQWARDLEVGNA